MSIGKKIERIRKSKGISQKDLGGKMGVSAAMIYQWESGIRNPKKETVERIADALGVPVEELG